MAAYQDLNLLGLLLRVGPVGRVGLADGDMLCRALRSHPLADAVLLAIRQEILEAVAALVFPTTGGLRLGIV